MVRNATRFWRFLAITLGSLAWISGASASVGQAFVKHGVLDLRSVSWDEHIEARGDWEFYWQKLLTPESLDANGPEVRAFMPVPGFWTGSPEALPAKGYATYRLHVLLPNTERIAVFFPGAIWSSSRIFVDGQLVVETGKVGADASSTSPLVAPRLYEFRPRSPAFDILVQTANFEFFLAGMAEAPRFGQHEVLNRDTEQNLIIDTLIVGVLLIMAFYHMVLYSLRKEDRSTLWFGLLCLAIAAHFSMSRTGLRPSLLTCFLPESSFNNRIRFFSISWMSAVVAVSWYTHDALKGIFKRRVCHITSWLAIAFIGLVLVSPPSIFVPPTVAFELYTVGLWVYVIYSGIVARRKGVEDSSIFLSGVLILLVAIVCDMLSTRRLIPAPPLVGFGLFGFVFLQSYSIAHRFSMAFAAVRISERKNRELSEELKVEHARVVDLNTNLERMVDEKTRDIRSIMQHIPLGIFMIDRRRKVHKDHSAHLREFYDGQNLDAVDAAELVFSDSLLNSDEQHRAISCIDASLGEDSLNFEVNANGLPGEIRRERNGTTQFFDLTWNSIEDGARRVDKILVTIRDVTEIRKLQESSRDQRQELEFIGEILDIPPARFLRFMQSCRSLVNENRKLISSHGFEKRNFEVLKLLFINSHTIKGAARSLCLKKLSHVFHSLEHYYAHLQKDQDAFWDINRMNQELDEACNVIAVYERIASEKLGRSLERAHHVEFRSEQVELLYRLMDRVQSREPLSAASIKDMEKATAILRSKAFKDCQSVFGDILASLPVLAKDLHKEVPEVRLHTQGLLLTENGEEVFSQIFVHVLRNSMDHGIETAAERLAARKAPQGLITIDVRKENDRVVVSYRDDGRGLALGKIRELGLGKGLMNPDQGAHPMAVADLIFHPALSTANRITDISGRGIGMSAVRQYLEDCGGRISIELKPGHETQDFCPFAFRIEMPLELFNAAGGAGRHAA